MIVRGRCCLIAALFASGLLSIVSCSSDPDTQTLRIATDATFAPFHLIDETGKTTGFDIELVRSVATQAGYEPTVVVLPYDDMFSQLKEGSIDIVAATTGVTPEREKDYLFSDPYFETCQVAVVRIGSDEPQELRDLKGLRIGADGEGTSKKAMMTLDGVPVALDGSPGVDALHTENVDAWIVDEFDGLAAEAISGGQLRIIPEAVAMEEYAFVIGKNHPELKSRIDRGLSELTASGRVSELRVEFGIERSAACPGL